MKHVLRRQVVLGGSVVDAATGEPVPGALVAAGDARATADAAGRFGFLDLPSGSYSVTAAHPRPGLRYGPATARARVTRTRAGDARLAWVDLQLPSTTIAGKVTAGGKPVPLASVHLVGGPERTYTDGQGRYALGGIEAGRRTLRVRARGFRPADVEATVDAPGSSKTVNVALTAASS